MLLGPLDFESTEQSSDLLTVQPHLFSTWRCVLGLDHNVVPILVFGRVELAGVGVHHLDTSELGRPAGRRS